MIHYFAMSSGYSGTPLVKKLGIKASTELCLVNAPEGYAALIEPLPAGVKLVSRPGRNTDIIHLFTAERKMLTTSLQAWRKTIKPDGTVWVSWPKKASKVPTDITEDSVREIALPLGFVDIKVCAVTDVWSGLKLVIRKELRKQDPL